MVPSVVSALAACLPPVLREDMSALPVVEGTFLIEVQPVSVRLERNVSPLCFGKVHWNYVIPYLTYGQCFSRPTWISFVLGEGWGAQGGAHLPQAADWTGRDHRRTSALPVPAAAARWPGRDPLGG